MFKRKKYMGYLIAFAIYSSKSFAQTSIDYDNILNIKIYVQDKQYMKNKVRQVRVYEEKQNEKKYLCDDLLIDADGYIVSRKRFDKFLLNDTETFSIKREGFDFIVSRSINKYSLLRGGLIPLSFWEVYFGVLKYTKSDSPKYIQVRSFYTGTKDSSFNFTTYVNDRKVDSGVIITNFTKTSIDSSGMLKNIERITIKDTLILREKEKINDSIYTIKEKYYYNRFLIKEKRLNYSKDLLIGVGFNIYKYDENGRIISETVYHNGGKYYSGKFYEYDDTKNTYTVMEDIYNADNRYDKITKYNTSGIMIEKIQNIWFPNFIERKWVFIYKPNGLLKEKQYWNNGVLTDKYYYDYTYNKKKSNVLK